MAAESGCAGYLLRPLSALRLPETEPESRGWVDRRRLLDLEGRSRRRQFALAAEYGLPEVPPVAGGCLLTERHLAARLRDLRRHGLLRDAQAIALLRVGRHFRLPGGARLLVGRQQADNAALAAQARPEDTVLSPDEIPGPTVLLPGGGSPADVQQAAAICAGYSDAAGGPVAITVHGPGGTQRLQITPADRTAADAWRIA